MEYNLKKLPRQQKQNFSNVFYLNKIVTDWYGTLHKL